MKRPLIFGAVFIAALCGAFSARGAETQGSDQDQDAWPTYQGFVEVGALRR